MNDIPAPQFEAIPTDTAASAIRVFSETQAREALRVACLEAGGQAEWARKHELTRIKTTICLCLRGRRGVSPAIAEALGFSKRVVFTLDNDAGER